MLKSVEKENSFNQNYCRNRTSFNQIELDYGKLLMFLKEYGQFPSKHRPDIWSFLLKLPYNEEEFGELERMGNHEFYKDVDSKLEPR